MCDTLETSSISGMSSGNKSYNNQRAKKKTKKKRRLKDGEDTRRESSNNNHEKSLKIFFKAPFASLSLFLFKNIFIKMGDLFKRVEHYLALRSDVYPIKPRLISD